MRNTIFVSISLLIINVFSSCNSNNQFNYQKEYEKSKSAWENFKKKSNNSYKYTATFNSVTGFGWETEVSVKKGIVIERKFKYIANDKGALDNVKKEDLQWTENQNQLGTHEDGADPITLDEVYSLSKQDWLSKKENAKAYFEAKNNGMISTCGYVEDFCMDDCFIGININNIQAL